MTASLLDVATLPGTGHGVRIAIIDSGVHASHPHVQGVAGGAAFDPEGNELTDYVDRLGHGTAVAAAIREKAPNADILVVKIFHDTLAASGQTLVRAIDWSVQQRVDLINLSLGTTNAAHEEALAAAVARAVDANAQIVAAAPQEEARWLPGALRRVVRVEVDWTIPREAARVTIDSDQAVRLAASGFARPIPGVPPERNIKGPSLAVANATGLLARLLSDPVAREPDVFARLRTYCPGESAE